MIDRVKIEDPTIKFVFYHYWRRYNRLWNGKSYTFYDDADNYFRDSISETYRRSVRIDRGVKISSIDKACDKLVLCYTTNDG